MPLSKIQIQNAVDELAAQFHKWRGMPSDWHTYQHEVKVDGRVFRAVLDPSVIDILKIWEAEFFPTRGRIEVAETGRIFQYAEFSISHCGYREFRVFAEAVLRRKSACQVGIHGYDVRSENDDSEQVRHLSYVKFDDEGAYPLGLYTGRVESVVHKVISATPVFFLETSADIAKLNRHDYKVKKGEQAALLINEHTLTNMSIREYDRDDV